MTYAALFLSAFTSATLLPGSSEAALVALLALGRGEPGLLVAVATVGNVLGSCVNWAVGRSLHSVHDRAWFPVKPGAFGRAEGWFRRYGIWSLLLSWVPVVGGPLTLVAGALGVRLLTFVLLVSVGRAAKYLMVLGGFLWWSA